MRTVLIRYWALTWGVVLLCILALAVLRRHSALEVLGNTYAKRLTRIAESGYPGAPASQKDDWEVSQYLPVQDEIIFLFNRGNRNPKLMRTVLLCEARRCYDWKYTYSTVRNYDLQRGLIQQCLQIYPDDLRVAWASGQLNLAAGDWEEAREQLRRVVDAAGNMKELRTFGDSIGREGLHILGRYCASLTFCGEDKKAGQFLRDWHAASPADPDVNYLLTRWLQDHRQTGEANEVLNSNWAHREDGTFPEGAGRLAQYVFEADFLRENPRSKVELASTLDALMRKASIKTDGFILDNTMLDGRHWVVNMQYQSEVTLTALQIIEIECMNDNWSGACSLLLSDRNFPVDVLPHGSGQLCCVESTRLMCALALKQRPKESALMLKHWGYWDSHGSRDVGEFAILLDFQDEDYIYSYCPFLPATCLALLRSPYLARALQLRGESFAQFKAEFHELVKPNRHQSYDGQGEVLLPGVLD